MTVKDIATSDLLDRINHNQEFNKEYGLAYLLGYMDCAKGFLTAVSTLFAEGYKPEQIQSYVDHKLHECDLPWDHKCQVVDMTKLSLLESAEKV